VRGLAWDERIALLAASRSQDVVAHVPNAPEVVRLLREGRVVLLPCPHPTPCAGMHMLTTSTGREALRLNTLARMGLG
jgi:hypothetical protein